MPFKLFVGMLALCFSQTTQAQIAYDGGGDYKFFVGYNHIGANSGLALQYDVALGDVVSYGLFCDLLFNPKDKLKSNANTDLNEFENQKMYNFFNSFDIGMFLRTHYGPLLHTEKFLDPYIGLDFSLKSIAGHAGVKYKITDLLGVYASYTYSFSDSFYNLLPDDDTATYTNDFESTPSSTRNFFGKQQAFSVGVTFNIDY